MGKRTSRTIHWIEVRLREIGLKKSHLAHQLGIQPSRITDIINGDRAIKTAEIPKLAAALSLSESDIMGRIKGETFAPIGPVPDEFDADAEAFNLIDVVASVRALTAQERLELFRKLTPLVAALRPKAR